MFIASMIIKALRVRNRLQVLTIRKHKQTCDYIGKKELLILKVANQAGVIVHNGNLGASCV